MTNGPKQIPGSKPIPGIAELVGRATLLLGFIVVPALEVRWDVRSSVNFRHVSETLGILRWPDVLAGMLLTNSYFAISAGVVLSFVITDSAARRSVVRRVEREDRYVIEASLAEYLAPAMIITLVWIMHGIGSALVCMAAVILTRLGRTRQHLEWTVGDLAPATQWEQRALAIADWTVLLAGGALLICAITAAGDGRAWAPVLECHVANSQESSGVSPSRVRVIELDRDGTGVVGWRLDNGEVIEGRDCTASTNDRVREEWGKR